MWYISFNVLINKFTDSASRVVNRTADGSPWDTLFVNFGKEIKNMEFSVLHRMGSDSDPNDTVGRRDLELCYIWAFPTLSQAGINMFV